MPCRCDDYEPVPEEKPDFHQQLCKTRSLLAKLYRAWQSGGILDKKFADKVKEEIKLLADHKREEMKTDIEVLRQKMREIDGIKEFALQCGVENAEAFTHMTFLKGSLGAKLSRMIKMSDDELLFG